MSRNALFLCIVFPMLTAPAASIAQVYRCQGPNGTVSYSERQCAGGVSTGIQTQQLAPPQGGDTSRVDGMRMETIQLMIANGKINEARLYARTPEERAIVSSHDQAARADRKESDERNRQIEFNRQREIKKGQRRRW